MSASLGDLQTLVLQKFRRLQYVDPSGMALQLRCHTPEQRQGILDTFRALESAGFIKKGNNWEHYERAYKKMNEDAAYFIPYELVKH